MAAPAPYASGAYSMEMVPVPGRTVSVGLLVQHEEDRSPIPSLYNVFVLNRPEAALQFQPTIQRSTVKEFLEAQLACMDTSVSGYDSRSYGTPTLLDPVVTLNQVASRGMEMEMDVKFTSIYDFVSTPACVIFDGLHVPICHGFLVDPEDETTRRVIHNHSHDSLLSALGDINLSNEDKAVIVTFLEETFLEGGGKGVTPYGISQLQERNAEGQAHVLHKNGHFHTLVKLGGELKILVGIGASYNDGPWLSLSG